MVASTCTLEAPQDSLFSRPQIVSRIIELNPTSTVAYLASFTDKSLHQYLSRLNGLQTPRMGSKGWIRPTESPAIICRESMG